MISADDVGEWLLGLQGLDLDSADGFVAEIYPGISIPYGTLLLWR